MQETLDDHRSLSFRWLVDAGWCVLGIFAAIAVGTFSGWLESSFDTWFIKLLIIYLILLAAACWIIISYFLGKARVRFGGVALVVSLLIMMGFLVGYEIPGYFQFRQAVKERLLISISNQSIDPNSVDLEATVNRFIYKTTGQEGFMGYVQLRVIETPLDFFLRVIVGAGIAIWSWRKFYIKPYCNTCRDFYKGARMAGGVLVGEYEQFKILVESGNLYAAGQMLRESIPGYPKVLIYLQSCPNPGMHASYLIADRFFIRQGERKVYTQNLMRTQITGVQYTNFRSGINTPRPEPIPVEQAT
jgi:hypothetical protein